MCGDSPHLFLQLFIAAVGSVVFGQPFHNLVAKAVRTWPKTLVHEVQGKVGVGTPPRRSESESEHHLAVDRAVDTVLLRML